MSSNPPLPSVRLQVSAEMDEMIRKIETDVRDHIKYDRFLASVAALKQSIATLEQDARRLDVLQKFLDQAHPGIFVIGPNQIDGLYLDRGSTPHVMLYSDKKDGRESVREVLDRYTDFMAPLTPPAHGASV